MALRVWRPTTPSMAPGLNPAAFSLPCSSRISSGVSGAVLGCAVEVDLPGPFPAGGEATGGEEVAGGETGGAETDKGGGVCGEAGGAPTAGPVADGGGTDDRTVTSRLPAGETSGFACSIRFDGNGVEA